MGHKTKCSANRLADVRLVTVMMKYVALAEDLNDFT